jgi:cytochrome c oxidase assembly protein subunit 15
MSHSPETSRPLRGVHRFAVVLACLVILLISAGAFVTSKEAGLSVPDWPLSYGSMNPPHWWKISNVRAEHGHRLIAGTVALLTIGLMIWVRRREARKWVRGLAYLAVVAVFLQAALGGITVLLFLPTAVSVSHAALAEIFLCLVVTLAVVTSRSWMEARDDPAAPEVNPEQKLPILTTGLIYAQILVGAVMRHSGAGLAIPDFPLSFGRLIPPEFNFAIGIHFAHRLGALAVLAAVVLVVVTVVRRVRQRPARLGIFIPTVAMGCLVVVQVSLGAAVVLTGKSVMVNTAHVATGATLLATSLVLSLNAARHLAAAGRDNVTAGNLDHSPGLSGVNS